MIYEYQKDEREITLRFNLFSNSYFFFKTKAISLFYSFNAISRSSRKNRQVASKLVIQTKI